MSIPTTCTNPDCTSRLHFVSSERAYQEWIESLNKDEEEE